MKVVRETRAIADPYAERRYTRLPRLSSKRCSSATSTLPRPDDWAIPISRYIPPLPFRTDFLPFPHEINHFSLNSCMRLSHIGSLASPSNNCQLGAQKEQDAGQNTVSRMPTRSREGVARRAACPRDRATRVMAIHLSSALSLENDFPRYRISRLISRRQGGSPAAEAARSPGATRQRRNVLHSATR